EGACQARNRRNNALVGGRAGTASATGGRAIGRRGGKISVAQRSNAKTPPGTRDRAPPIGHINRQKLIWADAYNITDVPLAVLD
ncbi:hypothetical protein CWI53_05555, partial [Neisseria meningitidis]